LLLAIVIGLAVWVGSQSFGTARAFERTAKVLSR